MVEKFGMIEGISGLLLEEQVDALSLERESNMRGWELGEYQELYSGLVEFMGSVLTTDHDPFEIRYDRGIKYAVAKRPTLTRHMRWCHAFMDLYWPGCHYSADLQLFSTAIERHRFGMAGPKHPSMTRISASLRDQFWPNDSTPSLITCVNRHEREASRRGFRIGDVVWETRKTRSTRTWMRYLLPIRTSSVYVLILAL